MKFDKETGSHVETIEFTRDEAAAWELPPFQRALQVNAKVKEVAEHIKADGGVLPGVLSFGIIGQKKYLYDGQQRREAFMLSGHEVGYADCTFRKFTNMAEMAKAFVDVNSHLVNMKPDDILRGMECCLPTLQKIRKECPWIGYDNIRRSDRCPVQSMSVTVRCWMQSANEVPGGNCGSSANLAEVMTDEDATNLIKFLGVCMTAWGRDQEYWRLWGRANMTICMWLYRRLVMSAYSAKTGRLTAEQFCKCLMGLSANPIYVDWLQGRVLSERDRAPVYSRIKSIFAARITEMTGKKAMLPAPPWSLGTKG